MYILQQFVVTLDLTAAVLHCTCWDEHSLHSTPLIQLDRNNLFLFQTRVSYIAITHEKFTWNTLQGTKCWRRIFTSWRACSATGIVDLLLRASRGYLERKLARITFYDKHACCT